jgi:hypothetical protein
MCFGEVKVKRSGREKWSVLSEAIISKSLRSFPFQCQTAQVIGRSILNLRFLLFSPHAQL